MSFINKSSFNIGVDYFGLVYLAHKLGWKVDDRNLLYLQAGLFELFSVVIVVILFKISSRKKK